MSQPSRHSFELGNRDSGSSLEKMALPLSMLLFMRHESSSKNLRRKWFYFVCTNYHYVLNVSGCVGGLWRYASQYGNLACLSSVFFPGTRDPCYVLTLTYSSTSYLLCKRHLR